MLNTNWSIKSIQKEERMNQINEIEPIRIFFVLKKIKVYTSLIKFVET